MLEVLFLFDGRRKMSLLGKGLYVHGRLGIVERNTSK